MKVYEVILPATAIEMHRLGKTMLLDYRTQAKKFGITIDGGGQSAHNGLPVLRKDYMLFGGTLIPNGGERAEAKRADGFEYRAEEFLKALHKELMKFQVHGLNDDLGLNYHVYCGYSTSPGGTFEKVDSMDPKKWFHGARRGSDFRRQPTIGPITWMIAK